MDTLDGPRLYTLRDPQSFAGQLYVRSRGNSDVMSRTLANIVQGLDGDQVRTPQPLQSLLDHIAIQIKSIAYVTLFVATIAVVLSVVGVYGVLSFSISQRMRDFGVQMALGAPRQVILRSVMMRYAKKVVIGFGFGLLLALPAAWTLMRITTASSLNIKALDPLIYLFAALILSGVSLCAMYFPALRATQADPVDALRNQ